MFVLEGTVEKDLVHVNTAFSMLLEVQFISTSDCFTSPDNYSKIKMKTVGSYFLEKMKYMHGMS